MPTKCNKVTYYLMHTNEFKIWWFNAHNISAPVRFNPFGDWLMFKHTITAENVDLSWLHANRCNISLPQEANSK